MLKVLLVDDEPFILQGIKVIIDWEKEGFEIAATAENGLEALEYLKKEKVDLIIADIRMPGMTGLELLEQIRREEISDAYFVILSGYAEFDYARRAMQNKCTEYLLKPVDRETLLKLLHKVRALSDRERQESKAHEEMEHAYFSRHLISLIHGKYDDVNLNYVKKHMKDTQGIRYVEIQKEQPNNLEEQSDKDLRNFQRELYDCCREFLKEDAKHCVFDVSADEKIYDIGFVYSENLAERLGMDDKTYLSAFRQYLVNNTKQPVIMLSWACTAFAAAMISSSVASSFPYAMLSRIVPEKRKLSCVITPIWARRLLMETSVRLWPSTRTVPEVIL